MNAIPLDDLRGLAGVYFGQEWEEIADTPRGLVLTFVTQQGDGGKSRAIEDIDAILAAGPGERELAALWTSTLGSSFPVKTTGMTYRQWFEHLRVLLRAALETPPATS